MINSLWLATGPVNQSSSLGLNLIFPYDMVDEKIK